MQLHTRIKICGMSGPEVAIQAARAGADYLGLVFAPSRRQLTPAKAHAIAEAVRQLVHPPALVGVFVNAPAEEVNRTAKEVGLDRVQLSGDETWDYCREIDLPILKTVHISPDDQPGQVRRHIARGYEVVGRHRLIIHLDAPVGDYYGGTGKTFDWRVAREVCSGFPAFIAGGLSPQNVGHLIGEVRPWGVDISSGVETGGKKDIIKIREFIGAVRQAENKK